MYKCINCEKEFEYKSKLLRHFLVYLPYYFGDFICCLCNLRFDSELKLTNHCIRYSKEHNSNFKKDTPNRTQFFKERITRVKRYNLKIKK